jgi:hypothetical protein
MYLLASILCLIGAVVVAAGGRWAGGWLADHRRAADVSAPEPRREIDMERLHEIAAVPIEDIIKAAEWRAEHPDEPQPEILANLDPATWATEPPQVPARSHSLPPPPKPSAGGPTSARAELSPGYIMVAPPSVERFGSELLKAMNRGGKAVVLSAGMEVKPLPVRPNPYARCRHEDAEREEIRSLDSAEPVKVIVTECRDCDRIAELRTALAAQAERIKAMAADWAIDATGHCTVTSAQRDAYQRAVADAQEIKKLILDMESRGQTKTTGLGWML